MENVFETKEVNLKKIFLDKFQDESPELHKKINDFIKANSSGYYYIIGNPGIGKSALAAKYATDNNTLLHFINYLLG